MSGTTHGEDYVLQQIAASGLPEKIDAALHFLEEFKARHKRASLLEDKLVSLECVNVDCAKLGLELTWPPDDLTAAIKEAAEELETVYISPVDPSVCALRSVPMDMIARSVLVEVGGRQNLTTESVFRALIAIWDRYDGHGSSTQADVDRILTELTRQVPDENSDAVDPFSPSSYLPHNGVARLREGG